MPLFSIVIPTRNRAHLLQYALQGALEQTFTDYEIIVSDNNSSDRTREVVDELGGGRVQYTHTGRSLATADNWEHARSHTRGEYVLLIGDDDCPAPSLLSALATALEQDPLPLITCGSAGYFSSDYPDPRRRNQLYVNQHTGQYIVFDAKSALRDYFGLRTPGFEIGPYAAYSQSLIRAIVRRAGRLYFGPLCDRTAQCMALSLIDNFSFLDTPLIVVGKTPTSATTLSQEGAVCKRPDVIPEAIDSMLLPGLYHVNVSATGRLAAKRAMPEYFADLDLGWDHYYVEYYSQLRRASREGVDTQHDLAQLQQRVNDLSPLLRWKVRKGVWHIRWQYDRRPAIGSALRRIPGAHGLALKLYWLLINGYRRASDGSGPLVLYGDQVGFSNQLECARMLDTLKGVIGPQG